MSYFGGPAPRRPSPRSLGSRASAAPTRLATIRCDGISWNSAYFERKIRPVVVTPTIEWGGVLRARRRADRLGGAYSRWSPGKPGSAEKERSFTGGALSRDLRERRGGARRARRRRGRGPAAQNAFGGGAHLGAGIEDRDVAQDRHRLDVTDPIERGDQVQATRRRRGVDRGFDLRDRLAFVDGQPFGCGWNQRVVAAHQNVDLVGDVAVRDVLASGGHQDEQGRPGGHHGDCDTARLGSSASVRSPSRRLRRASALAIGSAGTVTRRVPADSKASNSAKKVSPISSISAGSAVEKLRWRNAEPP